MNKCPRCLKHTRTDGVHTCTPTEAWRKLEAQRDALLDAAKKTIAVNLHLADGDNCTLFGLKQAIALCENKT